MFFRAAARAKAIRQGKRRAGAVNPERKLGVDINPGSLAGPRKIAERDHNVYIATIRKFGFMRGTPNNAKDSGHVFLQRTRRLSKRGAARMVLAIKESLGARRASNCSAVAA